MIAANVVPFILASSSTYRSELLARLGMSFRQVNAGVDESPQPGEAPAAIAARLASSKARAVARANPGSLVLGSDQVAECAGRAVGKPAGAEEARRQLRASSGTVVVFHTAICLIDTRADPAIERTDLDTTWVTFRELGDADIARYIEREKPLDCAGSFKVEGLGIALFERIESKDPSALIGLPLIAVCRLLRAAGVEPL